MKMWSVLCFAVCMMLAVVACSPAGTDSTAPKEEAPAVAPDAAPEAAPATEAAPAAPAEAAPVAAPVEAAPATAPAADAAAAPAAAGDPAALVGTTWKLGDFTINFKDAAKVNIKGGPFPDGMDADYKVENGNLSVSVMGQTKTGKWDGTTLTIDDKAAEKL